MCEMIDAAAHKATMAAVARGEQEMLAAEETVAAPTQLTFWRAKRGLTEKQLSQTVGISQSYIADLEAGRRKGDAALLERLARALRLRMEDLVAEEVLAEPASRPKKEMAP
jgi:ribosome-binding protein aMBF1 (putative translation factor)